MLAVFLSHNKSENNTFNYVFSDKQTGLEFFFMHACVAPPRYFFYIVRITRPRRRLSLVLTTGAVVKATKLDCAKKPYEKRKIPTLALQVQDARD